MDIKKILIPTFHNNTSMIIILKFKNLLSNIWINQIVKLKSIIIKLLMNGKIINIKWNEHNYILI